MTQGEWLLAGSTIIGPVLAVQAQKWVERGREAGQRRTRIFSTLMATRQARVSVDHVLALNSIDLAFYGNRLLGRVWRRRSAQEVLDAWHDYHAHLSIPEGQRPKNEAEQRAWDGRGDELFTNLLDRLAVATHFKFDRAVLKAGSYSPLAHGEADWEQQAIRKLLLQILSGSKALPMEVKSWPVDPSVADQQKEMQGQLLEILNRLAIKQAG